MTTQPSPTHPSATVPEAPSAEAPVLVVDLDGTLCRTDTLHEAALNLMARAPFQALALARSLLSGKAAFKARMAEAEVINGSDLPLNTDVIAAIKAARAEGRRTALVTASHQRQAEAVASVTELFDEVHGSTEARNLKGAEKAAFLTERYGKGGFDYMGDSQADLPVWAAARRAITVGGTAKLQAAAADANPDVEHIAPAGSKARPMLKAMRPHQWSKNVLLFLPLLASHQLSAFGDVLLGFVAFCLTASAVYVLNDLVDLSADRAHPRKCRRPFAAGDLSAATGVAMAGGLLLMALILGLATGNPLFIGVLAGYLVLTFAYSLWLKRKLLVDVLMLAALYTIRIVAGGAAAAVVLSPWMLGFSMFLFLALAAVKRQAELTDQMKTGRESAGRAYLVEDLPILRGIALSAAHATVLVMALYISSDAVQQLYGRPELLWLVCPLLLYWLLRMVMVTHRGYMTDDPIVFAAKDRTSLLTVALSVCVVVVAAL
ncbi:UbiA family prenyltransferase [Tropicimonas sp. S265A]|uniref:UbiA family prenyltransferase n=1 Tax=Tropicimonas sp. S265A TaxID=3415134 RepID=UPI003C7C1836